MNKSGSRSIARWLLAGAILASAASLTDAQGRFRETAKLVPSDPMWGGFFGDAVAFSGDTIAVSASRQAGTIPEEGAVYVFRRSSTSPNTWDEVAKLSPSPPAPYFGQAVALSGDTLVVMHDSFGFNPTRTALVYERNAGGPEAWGQVAVLSAVTYEGNGENVDIDGDTIAVGSVANYGVKVYERDLGGPNAWGLRKTLVTPGVGCDYFGWSTELRQDTLAVGAPGDIFREGCGGPFGDVYVYERDAGGENAWGMTDHLKGGAGVFDFGRAVGLDDSSAARVGIGATSEAQVFERSGSEEDWQRTARIRESSPNFGYSVALQDDLLLVGEIAPEVGLVRAYERDDDGWITLTVIQPSDGRGGDRFGDSIAFEGKTLIVGAPYHQAGAPFSGAAYVFTLLPNKVAKAGEPPIPAASVAPLSTSGSASREDSLRLSSFVPPIPGTSWELVADAGSREAGNALLVVEIGGLPVLRTWSQVRSGRARFVVSIPDDPGLTGTSLHAQAALVNSSTFELSNVVAGVLGF